VGIERMVKALGAFKVFAGIVITLIGLLWGAIPYLYYIRPREAPLAAFIGFVYIASFLASGIVCTVSGVKDFR
jgi:hypothetical protein